MIHILLSTYYVQSTVLNDSGIQKWINWESCHPSQVNSVYEKHTESIEGLIWLYSPWSWNEASVWMLHLFLVFTLSFSYLSHTGLLSCFLLIHPFENSPAHYLLKLILASLWHHSRYTIGHYLKFNMYYWRILLECRIQYKRYMV